MLLLLFIHTQFAAASAASAPTLPTTRHCWCSVAISFIIFQANVWKSVSPNYSGYTRCATRENGMKATGTQEHESMSTYPHILFKSSSLRVAPLCSLRQLLIRSLSTSPKNTDLSALLSAIFSSPRSNVDYIVNWVFSMRTTVAKWNRLSGNISHAAWSEIGKKTQPREKSKKWHSTRTEPDEEFECFSSQSS